jgi:hypothetical protein
MKIFKINMFKLLKSVNINLVNLSIDDFTFIKSYQQYLIISAIRNIK